jgi:hypothetical protein
MQKRTLLEVDKTGEFVGESKEVNLTKLLVGDYVIPESEQVSIQQKNKKSHSTKSRAKRNKSKHRTTNNTLEDKTVLADLPKQHNGKLQIRRKAKERRKLKTFTRRLWGDDEDKAITRLVKKYGIKKWTLISRKLQEEYEIYGRSGKQCRER